MSNLKTGSIVVFKPEVIEFVRKEFLTPDAVVDLTPGKLYPVDLDWIGDPVIIDDVGDENHVLQNFVGQDAIAEFDKYVEIVQA